jgi:Glycosyl hydrolase family 1
LGLGRGLGRLQIVEAWNADGKGLSIWDVYADTLGKIKNEDTGDVANGRFHRYSRMLRCKIESPRSSRNGGFVLAACRCGVGSGRVSTCGQTSEPQATANVRWHGGSAGDRASEYR